MNAPSEMEEYRRKVSHAREYITVITPKEMAELDFRLIPITHVAERQEYWADGMADLNDWLNSAPRAVEDALILKALEVGGEVVVLHDLQEDSGLVTAVLSRLAEVYRWNGREAGLEKLREIRRTATQ